MTSQAMHRSLFFQQKPTMIKGIVWGLIAQFAYAIGLIFISQARFTEGQQLLKSNLVLVFSTCFSGLIVMCIFLAKPESVSLLRNPNWLYLLIGSLFLLVIGDYFFIAGTSFANVTTVTLTALAFPVFAFILEYLSCKMLGQKIPIVGTQEVIGFVFIASGFMIFAWGK